MAKFNGPGLRYGAAGFGIQISTNKWRGYIGFGNSFILHKDIWAFNPDEGNCNVDATPCAWKQLADLTGPARSHAASFVIGQNIFIGTGYVEDGSSNGDPIDSRDFWVFTP